MKEWIPTAGFIGILRGSLLVLKGAVGEAAWGQ